MEGASRFLKFILCVPFSPSLLSQKGVGQGDVGRIKERAWNLQTSSLGQAQSAGRAPRSSPCSTTNENQEPRISHTKSFLLGPLKTDPPPTTPSAEFTHRKPLPVFPSRVHTFRGDAEVPQVQKEVPSCPRSCRPCRANPELTQVFSEQMPPQASRLRWPPSWPPAPRSRERLAPFKRRHT